MKHIVFAALLVTSLLPLAAPAQWLWVDKEGRKVFSDRPPPASVADKDILKRPGQARDSAAGSSPAATLPASEAATPASRPASAGAPKLSALDKELAERKKKAEQLDADKRQADEAKNAQVRADNCTRAKAAKASLDSGLRIGRINSKGEREIMDDASRAAEAKRIQGIIDVDCR